MAMTLLQLEDYVLRLESRVDTLESVVNSMQQAMLNLATQEQLRRINLIRQTEIDDLNDQLTALRAELALVKGEVFK